MAKIYTRTGDAGETSLLGGKRARKDAVRIKAIGSVDEVNATIGLVRMELARSGIAPVGIDALLATIQHRLFDLGAGLAIPPTDDRDTQLLSDASVVELEKAIDQYDAELPPLRTFILPGGSPAASQLHAARCVCRRAERRLVELMTTEPVGGAALAYLNRLSDLLFVLARAVNQANRVADVTWEQGGVK